MPARPARSIALAAVVSTLAAACFGGGPTTARTPRPPVTPRKGGKVVFGAEQWPECVNPITSCSIASWAWWSVLHHVLPRAMQFDLQGNYVASPMLAEAPTLENGGIQRNPFTITYRISDEAVWEDGSPITSADFDFTWRAIMNTTGAASTRGYSSIASIDTTDPKTAVINFKEVLADWQDLFGGFQGLIKRTAFPEFADDPTPDLKDEMLESIPFSGGPWILQSWSQDQAVLVRNDKYFGTVANLDQVTMVPRTDQATEIQSLLSGEVDAIWPQPSDVSLLRQISGNSGVKAIGGDGTFFEGLWFNHDSPPLDDPKVREAMMYAIDRQAVIDVLIKLNNPNAEVLGCGMVAFPHIGPWCQEVQPFSLDAFAYDPAKAREILTGDGYDCSETHQPCTKDGEPLTVGYTTVSTNTRRTTTQELLMDKALEAGVQFDVENYDAGVLFGDIGPKGLFTMVDFARGGGPVNATTSFACESIPTKANDFSGLNWNHWCNQEATDLLHSQDREADPDARLELMNQIYQLQAQDFVSLPLYVLPSVSAWRTDKLGGPVGAYNSTPYGLFFNMNEWFLRGA